MPEPTWTTHLYGLLLHPNQTMILVVTRPGSLQLPQANLAGELDSTASGQVIHALGPACVLPINVLRCLASVGNPQAHQTDGVFLIERRGSGELSGPLPDGWGWIFLNDFDAVELPDGVRIKVREWLERRPLRSIPPAPWALPGWYEQAESWITTEMRRLGRPVLAIEPVRSWCISAVLRVRSEPRPVYFKASLPLPLFVNEGVVMAELARLYPLAIPAPLAVEPARQWMLLDDLGKPIGRSAPLEQQVVLIQSLAKIQIVSAQKVDRLVRVGCIDRRIPWLRAHLKGLLADEVTLQLLLPREKEELRRAYSRLRALLEELEALPIPATLIHGDLHGGNVANPDGNLRIFDWTDAAVSHPFFDIDVIFSEENPDRARILAEAYLSVWVQRYSDAAVRHAFKLARVVYGLYHAVSYQYILNFLDESEHAEIHWAHYYLRQVLAGLAGNS